MTPKTFVLTASLAIPTAGLALDNADTDGDGMISMEELAAAYPDLVDEGIFTTLDADGSGALDADELAAAKQAGLLPMDDM